MYLGWRIQNRRIVRVKLVLFLIFQYSLLKHTPHTHTKKGQILIYGNYTERVLYFHYTTDICNFCMCLCTNVFPPKAVKLSIGKKKTECYYRILWENFTPIWFRTSKSVKYKANTSHFDHSEFCFVYITFFFLPSLFLSAGAFGLITSLLFVSL